MNDRNGSQPTVEESARRLKETAGEAVSEMRYAVKDAAESVKHGAADVAGKAREAAAGRSGSAADTLRSSADRLEAELPWLQTAMRKSAEGLDTLSRSLDRGDFEHTLSNISTFARQRPALFLGASVAAGFALARIGKTAVDGLRAAAEEETPAATESGALGVNGRAGFDSNLTEM